MHGPDKNAPENDPKQGGKPAPHDGDGRPDDGTGSGNGSEMMPKNDVTIRRYEINTVFLLDTGNRLVVLQLEDFSREKLAVSMIGNQKSNNRS